MVFKKFWLGLVVFAAFWSELSAQDLEPATADAEVEFIADGLEARIANVVVDSSTYRFAWWPDELGNALFQGDINIGTAEELQKAEDGLEPFGLAIRDESTRWPNGVMRFMVHSELPRKNRVYGAIAEWEGKTRITFEEIEKPTGNFVLFQPSQSGCNSLIGMRGGPQAINISSRCRQGSVTHEIGHALGLHHEQARSDRDKYVEVLVNLIREDRLGNFSTYASKYEDIGNYCYESIMHYPESAFPKAFGQTTIKPRKVGVSIGQRKGLASCDIATIQQIYGPFFDDAGFQKGFEGELVLYPAGCETNRKCYLANDIRFTDPYGIVWEAGRRDPGAGNEIQTGLTDGASIPGWAQPIIGKPYNRQYLLSAVVHDHYTYKENRVRPWRQTQRMFYNALVEQGVPVGKAKLMYFAVLVGGGKWVKLVPGENCGANCINDYSTAKGFVEDGFLVKPETFGSEAFLNDLETGKRWIESNGEALSLLDIEEFAAIVQPDDPFYESGATTRLAGVNDPTFD